jgi:hypothetical protein
MIAHASTLALAATLLFLVPAAARAVPSDDDPEQVARELLLRAEAKAEKGSYDQALSGYEKIVARYPNTEAGRVAEKRVTPNALLGWADLERNGPSANRVDVVIMGDGYTLGSLKKSFHSRAEEMVEAFDREDVLREYRPYFNFVRAAVVSADDGVDGYGREYDTALDAYVTSTTASRFSAVKAKKVEFYLDQLPSHDGVAIAIIRDETRGAPSGRVATVGGGKVDPDAVVHAWGHAFAGLGDEFSDNTDRHIFDPGERPNVSLTESPVPWQHWIDAKHASVGVYSGAAGRAKGAWRPVGGNCVMESGRDFCPVCREALVLAIYGVVDGIDGATPPPHDYASDEILEPALVPTATSRFESFRFEVRTMRPESHALEVSWWVLAEHRAPKSRGIALPHDQRRERGPLPPIESKPVQTQRVSRDGVYGLEIQPADHEPGRYRVICRAVDKTELRGERYPWVLKDSQGLLESERAWWIRIP